MVTVRESGCGGDYTSVKAAIDADETVIAIDLPWEGGD